MYRITKNSPTPIHDRQGFYIEAANQLEALKKAIIKFPDGKGLTFQKWN
jgi:hypothetical protein